jgi:hypothetical protein
MVKILIKHKLRNGEQARKYDIPKMSTSDLMWCFGTEVDFNDAETGEELLKIEDTVILGLAGEIAYAFEKALKSKGEEVRVFDYYGTFALTFKTDKEKNSVLIAERRQKKSFVITIDDFKQALNKWIHKIDHDMQLNFPEIESNPNYSALINELKQLS